MPDTKIETIKKQLKEKNYKLTRQRQDVLEVFAFNTQHHLSAEDVYNILAERSIDIGLTTVYRTLDILEKLDVLQKINFGDGHSRYELRRISDLHRHHHLICVRCGLVMEFADELLEALERSIDKAHGFEILDHQVKFFGYCKECAGHAKVK